MKKPRPLFRLLPLPGLLAVVLPTPNLSACLTRSKIYNTVPDVELPYTTQTATASVSQPLYRPANLATYKQGQRGVELAEAQLNSASQDLIIRVAQAYFDVLAAQDPLAFVRAQKTAAGEQLASAQRNFEVGTSAIAATRANTGTVGLSLNAPLFAGFATQNRIRETLSLEEKAQADLENTRRTVAQATRTAYFGLVSGRQQVKALESAESSSQLALEANQLGYQVGVRINIDVLNAQRQMFQTKRDLAQARYNVLLGQLKLRQANGTLVPDDLARLSALVAQPK